MPLDAWIGLTGIIFTIVVTVIGSVWKLSGQLAKTTTKFELIGAQQAVEISRMNTAIEKIEVSMASIAVDRERMAQLEQRVSKLERWYDELRRGIGRIDPPANSLAERL